MGRKFVRNITGTELTGKNVEPFDTNVQNDLLSDDQDVYVRQVRSNIIKDQYHCLTDNVKSIETESDLMEIENYKKGDKQEKKNKSTISLNKATKNDAEKGTSNSHIMTPLQTKNAIEYNNKNVIPSLVKEHETPTEIKSLDDRLTVKKTSKNNFELELDLPENENIDIEAIRQEIKESRAENIPSTTHDNDDALFFNIEQVWSTKVRNLKNGDTSELLRTDSFLIFLKDLRKKLENIETRLNVLESNIIK